jgi:predicted O-linked N-acetylglucosamine transferase (SPINDLY family)
MTADTSGRAMPPYAGAAGEIFRHALLAQQQGRKAQADALCEQVLVADPGHHDAWHLRGLLALQSGRLERGIEFIERSLALEPRQPAAHSNLGNAWLEQHQPQKALQSLTSALELKPDFVPGLYLRGNAMRELQLLPEALASYTQALSLQADHVAALNNRGLTFAALGRLEEAVGDFTGALRHDPGFTAAQRNLGSMLLRLERCAEALECYERLLRSRPHDAEAWCGRGHVLLALKRLEDAQASFTQALQIDPTYVDAFINRGHVRNLLQKFDAALADYERALQLAPDSVLALNNSGNVLLALGQAEAAVARYEHALQISPADPRALYNRGAGLRELRRYPEAAQCYEQLLQAAPDHDYALGNLFHLRMDGCDWSDYHALTQRLRSVLARNPKIINPLSLLLLDAPELAHACAQAYVREHHPGAPPASAASAARSVNRRIRLAYVSADFREHPVAYLLAGVLRQHDRARFEVLGVSLQPSDGSALAREVRASFDEVIEVRGRSDADVAALLRERQVDIAIDLMGFTQGMRLGIFAQRAAPLQVSFLGYAGTLGAPYVDYLLADKVVIPPGEEQLYSEQIVRLAHCYLPNDDRREIGPVPTRAQAGLPEAGFVFCAFTNPFKINPPLFEVWMSLLRQLPGSVLWLGTTQPDTRRNLAREAEMRGVAAERLVFAPRVAAMSDHLARMQLADLYLDTLPYNAHSTTCDALWAGVPVLTCAGRSFASRVAASALTAAGLPQLVTPSLADYERVALELGRDPVQLGSLRARLKENRSSAALFDTTRYTRELEAVYRAMHGRAVSALPPAALWVTLDGTIESGAAAPAESRAHCQRGNELLRRGELQGALECFERALALDPRDAVALTDCGTVLQELRRPEQAIAHYDRALRIAPASAVAYNNRGNALRTLRRYGEALESLEAALRIQPAFAEALNNRGNVLRELDRLEEALASFEASLELRPAFAMAHTNRGHTLLDLRRPREALASFASALRQVPDEAEALFGRALARLQLQEELEQAAADMKRAAALGIDRVETLVGEAATLAALRRHTEAVRCLGEVLALAPERDYARGSWLHSKLQIHDWSDLEALVDVLCHEVSSGRRVTHPHLLLAVRDSPALQQTCARVLVQDKFAANASLGPCTVRARERDRLRVAYVSADFGDHPVSHLLVGVLEGHDRGRFETIGVSLRRRAADGPFERRVRNACDRFVDVSERSDREAAQLLRELEVDIAVDLMGLTQDLRLGIFARRAAGVQVSYLGYAGTVGAPYIDYVLADGVVIPAGEERWFSEQVVRLPDCYLPTDDQRPIGVVPTRAAAGLPADALVWCAFTNAYKINPPVFEVWMRLLRELPESVLWLREMGAEARANLQQQAQRRGVSQERLVFAAREPQMAQHLARQSLADVYLDTFPYNAHSTACDALWAGVPVLTCAGRSFASRVAASALSAVGMPELITHSLEEYAAKALELGRAPQQLRQLRERLQRTRAASALFDTRRYCRHLESAFLSMHARAVQALPPAAFNVAPSPPSRSAQR